MVKVPPIRGGTCSTQALPSRPPPPATTLVSTSGHTRIGPTDPVRSPVSVCRRTGERGYRNLVQAAAPEDIASESRMRRSDQGPLDDQFDGQVTMVSVRVERQVNAPRVRLSADSPQDRRRKKWSVEVAPCFKSRAATPLVPPSTAVNSRSGAQPASRRTRLDACWRTLGTPDRRLASNDARRITWEHRILPVGGAPCRVSLHALGRQLRRQTGRW